MFERNKILLAVFLGVVFVTNANAGGLEVLFYDSILSSATGWVQPLLKVGTGIGVSFWLIESLVEINNQKLYNDGGALLMFAFKRSLIFGVLTGMFLTIDFYRMITTIILNPTQILTGFSMTGKGFGLNPADVWTGFINWLDTDFKTMAAALKWYNFIGEIELVANEYIYMGVCIILSFEIIMLNIKFAFTLYIGIIFAGCWGSNWLKEWWYKYVNSLISISLKILVFCLIYKAYSKSLSNGVLNNLANGSMNSNLLMQIISAVIACLCMSFIPKYIAGKFSGGAGGLSAREIIGSIAKGAKNASNATKTVTNLTNPSSGNGGGLGSSSISAPSSQAPINKAEKANALK